MPQRKSSAIPDPIADPLDQPEEEDTFGPEDLEQPEAPEEVDVDDVLQKAQAIAQEIGRVVKSDKRAASRKLKELESLLASITIAQVPELADSPTIQAFVQMFTPKDMAPGEVRNRGTLAEVVRDWQWRDVFQKFPMRQLVPMHTQTLTWNGLSWQIVAGEPCELPVPFYDIYIEQVRTMRSAEERVRAMLSPGAPVPRDPNFWDEHSAVVRAYTQLGSGRIGVGPIRDVEGPEAGPLNG